MDPDREDIMPTTSEHGGGVEIEQRPALLVVVIHANEMLPILREESKH